MIVVTGVLGDKDYMSMSEKISEIAARYGLGAENITISSFTDATLSADGNASVSYTLTAKTYSFSYTSSVKITIPGPKEPLIWRFNNDEVNAVWKPYTALVRGVSIPASCFFRSRQS